VVARWIVPSASETLCALDWRGIAAALRLISKLAELSAPVITRSRDGACQRHGDVRLRLMALSTSFLVIPLERTWG
jgi:hypothetical protein